MALANGITVCSDKYKKISCYSQVLIENFVHVWKLNDFDKIPFLTKYPVFSPNFTLGKRSDSVWQVVMTKHQYYPDKKKIDDYDDDSEEYDDEGDDEIELSMETDTKQDLSESEAAEPKSSAKKPTSEQPQFEKKKRLGFRLVKVEETSNWEVVRYHFTLKAADGFEINSDILEEAGVNDEESRPVYMFFTEEDMNGRDLFKESYLEVICNIVFKYIEGSPYEAPEVFEGKNCADDMRLLYNSKKFSDVTLIVEGHEILAHKSILCARAYGFKKLLKEEVETPKQVVDLKVDEVVGQALVRFIYCGGIKEDFPLEKCLDLYEAAQTYGVTNLRKLCSKYFISNLSPDVCKKCLGIDADHVDDCLAIIRRLGSNKLKSILSGDYTCVHKPLETDSAPSKSD